VRRHLEAQLLGPVVQTAFREKKLPEANALSCATMTIFGKTNPGNGPAVLAGPFFVYRSVYLFVLSTIGHHRYLRSPTQKIFAADAVQGLISGPVVSVPVFPRYAAQKFIASQQSHATSGPQARLEESSNWR
jgi:hypothetical protein